MPAARIHSVVHQFLPFLPLTRRVQSRLALTRRADSRRGRLKKKLLGLPLAKRRPGRSRYARRYPPARTRALEQQRNAR